MDKLNRRARLRETAKATVGLVAAPLLYPGRLFGGEPASRKLNLACIGLGDQMQGLMQGLIEIDQNIVAICDVDAKRMADRRKAFGPAVAKAKAYNDYHRLLEREKSLDAVVSATPDHWHAAIPAAALKSGKHFCCEKPLTHTVAEARQLAALAKQSKVGTQTGNQGSASVVAGLN